MANFDCLNSERGCGDVNEPRAINNIYNELDSSRGNFKRKSKDAR